MKRLLLIAYHFPPLAGSSGIQRTLRFVQHLPDLGWEPLVLTAHPRAYGRVSDDLQADIPEGTVVRRAFALDTARHLATFGRYPGWLGRPDRWMSWRFDAVRTGLSMVREFRPHALWSTYPIATAHVIGARLQRLTKLPWIADFRDPMAQPGYPADALTWRSFVAIELQAFSQAQRCVFTTPSALRTYAERYPFAAERLALIENGYDEGSFAEVERTSRTAVPLTPKAVTLLHSGIVYPSERDPTHLFMALKLMAASGAISPDSFKLRFRAPVHDAFIRQVAETHGVGAYVEVCPPITYREALSEMMRADGLLVMQAANCNEQVPAKVYEYLRARRPIVCLADPAGDTELVLRRAGVLDFARLASSVEIASTLTNWLERIRLGEVRLPDPAAVEHASRHSRARQLAAILEGAVASMP